MTYNPARAAAVPRAHSIHRLIPPLLFEADTGTNPTGGAGGAQQGGAQQDSSLQALLQRHNNDAMALVASLYAENTTLRGQVPAQGAVVLAGADVQTWQGFRELNVSLTDLQQRLTDATTSAAELASLKREKLIADVAAIGDGTTKYEPAVLAQLAGADLPFEIRGEGDKRQVIVKDGDKETPLAEYAKAKWGVFLPALQVGTAQAGGTPFIPQHGGGGTAPLDPVAAAHKRFQDQRDAAANPLAPAAPKSPLS